MATRKSTPLCIEFDDQYPTQTGLYLYRAKRTQRNPEWFQLYTVDIENGEMWCSPVNRMERQPVCEMRGQFSQRMEVGNR